MAVGPPFRVEIVVRFVRGETVPIQQMQHRRQADDQQVERAKQFGVHRVTVHLVPKGVLVAGTIGGDDGKVAERHPGRIFGHLSRQGDAVVPIANLPDTSRERQPAQRHQILRELPHEEDSEYQDVSEILH